MNSNARIVPSSYKSRTSTKSTASGKENAGSNWLSVLNTGREPFLELPTNVRGGQTRRIKSTSQAVEVIYRYSKQTIEISKATSNAASQTTKRPACNSANCRRRTLRPSDEGALNRTEHYITFMAGIQAAKNKKSGLSPILPNAYTKQNTLVLVDDPETRVRRPAIKRTLAHKANCSRGTYL